MCYVYIMDDIVSLLYFQRGTQVKYSVYKDINKTATELLGQHISCRVNFLFITESYGIT